MQPKLGLILALSILFATTLGMAEGMADRNTGAAKSSSILYSKLPLVFEPNQGQAAEPTRFISHASGYDVQVMDTGIVVVGRATGDENRPKIVLQLLGGQEPKDIGGRDPMPGRTNYYVGHRSAWHLGIPQYRGVFANEVYPGIDVVYYGNQRQLEYDFVVAPGADPRRIQIGLGGTISKPVLDADGNVLLSASGRTLLLHRPVAYQDFGSERKSVRADYVLRDNTVLLALGEYDKRKPLVIDPTLSYTSYLGGSGLDSANAIAVDGAGNSYTTGQTCSTDLVSSRQYAGKCDAYVIALNASGSGTLYTTYIGGANGDNGKAIVVDATGIVTIAGITSSSDFPTQGPPFQASYGGGDNDAFVARLDASGNLIYSTFLGGSRIDGANGVALDSKGNIIVVGQTGWMTDLANDFPATGAYIAPYSGFITKLSASSGYQTAAFSKYFATTTQCPQQPCTCDGGNAVAVDSRDDIFVGGTTIPTCQVPDKKSAFVAKFSGTDGSVVYGWINQIKPSEGLAVAVDTIGQAVLAGNSKGSAFVEKVNPLGSDFVFNTVFGPSCSSTSCSSGNAVALDTNGAIYVGGMTSSPDLTVVSPTQPVLAGSIDAFVTKFDSTGSTQLFSTFFGGAGSDIASGLTLGRDPSCPTSLPQCAIYLAGTTYSLDLPVTSNALKSTNAGAGDAFVAKWTGTNLPFASLSRLQINFGDQTVKTSSTSQTITLKNLGDAPLEIFGINASGPYVETHTCGKSLDANSSCTISVSFAPSATGIQTGAVTVTDSFGSGTQTVALTGNGVSGSSVGGGTQGDFQLSLVSGTATVNAGNSATFTVTATPSGGLATTLTLSCAGPATITCAVAPSSVSLDGTTPVTAAVTVSTQARSSAVHGTVGWRLHGPLSRPDIFATAIQLPFGILGVVAIGAGRGRDQRRRRKAILGGSLLTLMVLLTLAGCGGGSRQTGGTQAGTYSVTITASTSQGTSLTHTVTATLTVN